MHNKKQPQLVAISDQHWPYYVFLLAKIIAYVHLNSRSSCEIGNAIKQFIYSAAHRDGQTLFKQLLKPIYKHVEFYNGIYVYVF